MAASLSTPDTANTDRWWPNTSKRLPHRHAFSAWETLRRNRSINKVRNRWEWKRTSRDVGTDTQATNVLPCIGKIALSASDNDGNCAQMTCSVRVDPTCCPPRLGWWMSSSCMGATLGCKPAVRSSVETSQDSRRAHSGCCDAARCVLVNLPINMHPQTPISTISNQSPQLAQCAACHHRKDLRKPKPPMLKRRLAVSPSLKHSPCPSSRA